MVWLGIALLVGVLLFVFLLGRHDRKPPADTRVGRSELGTGLRRRKPWRDPHRNHRLVCGL